jgi:hypothetical protein
LPNETGRGEARNGSEGNDQGGNGGSVPRFANGDALRCSGRSVWQLVEPGDFHGGVADQHQGEENE